MDRSGPLGQVLVNFFYYAGCVATLSSLIGFMREGGSRTSTF